MVELGRTLQVLEKLDRPHPFMGDKKVTKPSLPRSVPQFDIRQLDSKPLMMISRSSSGSESRFEA